MTPIVGSHVVNSAPEITSPDTGTVVENADTATAIYTATATDADSDQITWDLAGRDKDLLEISSTGVVTLKNPADYESNQTDYQFDVVADDGTATPVTKSVTVTVTNNPSDDPVFTETFMNFQGRVTGKYLSFRCC